MSATINSREIIGKFYDRLQQDAGNGWIPDIAMYMTSDQASEEYNWLSMVPAMRKWEGGRNAKGLTTNSWTVTNEDYESTMEFTLKELQRDKSGQVDVRIAEQAQRALTHWNTLVSDLLIAGESTACYDGQYFFDTDHSEGSSGTQSNDISVDISALPASVHGSTTAPSVEEMQQAVLQGITQITTFVDDQAEPKNEFAREFTVMVPASMAMVAYNAFSMPPGTGVSEQREADGFRIKFAVNTRLSAWTTKFAVFRTDAATKPFIIQEEVPLEVSAIAEGSELEFKERKHQYGLYSSRGANYGMWDKACLVTLA